MYGTDFGSEGSFISQLPHHLWTPRNNCRLITLTERWRSKDCWATNEICFLYFMNRKMATSYFLVSFTITCGQKIPVFWSQVMSTLPCWFILVAHVKLFIILSGLKAYINYKTSLCNLQRVIWAHIGGTHARRSQWWENSKQNLRNSLKFAWEKCILAAFETSVGFEPVSLILTFF